MLDFLTFFFVLLSNSLFFACYIGNQGTFPQPLSAEDELIYLQRMNNGDKEAKNILIERNLRLVTHVLKKYVMPGSKETEDLISIGTIGLIKGITSYKNEKGTRLATYVARCIENEILMYMRSQKKLQNEVSLNEPIGTDREGNEITLYDIMSDDGEKVFEEVALKIQVKNLYEKMKEVLQKRERIIIAMRYGLKCGVAKTQHEIAKLLGISRSYVSRIEKKALEKLHRHMENTTKI